MIVAKLLAASTAVGAAASTVAENASSGTNPYSVIALCSLAISIITTVIMLVGQRHSTKTDYVSQLEDRIEAQDRDLEQCQEKIKSLTDRNDGLTRENIELYRKLARMDLNDLPGNA